MIVSVPGSGSSGAAPTPCTARAATSDAAFGARPQAGELTPNTVRPVVTMRLWPYRSPAVPLGSINEASALTPWAHMPIGPG
jgi:hypothetical protein